MPGRAVRGSRSGRPLFALLDLMTRRWAMRIVWELQSGDLSYRELQRSCDGMSSSTLAIRLRELTDAGVVTRRDDGAYGLTALAVELPAAFEPLIHWSARWAESDDEGSPPLTS